MLLNLEQLAKTCIGEINRKDGLIFVLDIDAVNAERMLKLQRFRSGHQGHLTELNNKISILLYDFKNIETVKELLELFSRQRERFNLIHNEILFLADHEPSTIASVMHAHNDQLARKTELLYKATNYLQSREREYPLPDNLETRSNATILSKTIDYTLIYLPPLTFPTINSYRMTPLAPKTMLSLCQMH